MGPQDVRPAGLLARMAELPPWAPPLAGLALVGVAAVLLAVLPERTGQVPGRTLRFPVFFAVMSGFYVAIMPWVVRRALASTAGLRGVDEASRAAFREALAHLPLRWILPFVCLLVLMHARIVRRAGIEFASYLDMDLMLSTVGFSRMLGWVHVGLVGVSLAILLRHAVLFRRLGASLRDVDLLDRAALAPFVQASFRTTGVFVLACAGIAAFHVRGDFSGLVNNVVVAMLPSQAFIAVALFLLPIWGAHQSLGRAREAELGRILAALRGDREALRESLLGGEARNLGAVELLTYREHVRAFPTWPFDASALVRLALLTAVPVFGWLGGALVERALDTVLD